jgi:hypothetical protein
VFVWGIKTKPKLAFALSLFRLSQEKRVWHISSHSFWREASALPTPTPLPVHSTPRRSSDPLQRCFDARRRLSVRRARVLDQIKK